MRSDVRMPEPPFGHPMTRAEDAALLRGAGTFVDDLHLPGMLHAAILRSPVAHGEITAVDTGDALRLPGVRAVLTAADLGPVGRRMPAMASHPALVEERTGLPLAARRVRYVGEPVALVVAEDRYIAEDALDNIAVAYEPLPVIVEAAEAVRPGAPRVHQDMADNVAGVIRHAAGDVGQALKDADLVLRLDLWFSRACGQPIETRAILATTQGPELMIWCATQKPHRIRAHIAEMLGLPEYRVRVVAPHIGGGFGPKGRFYPEYVLIPWAAMRLGRPVKYIEDRREHFLAALQEREQVHAVEAAVRADGTLLGLRTRFVHDMGAYVDTGLAIPSVTAEAIPGPYRIPHYAVEATCVYTHRVPTAPVRGAGRQHAVFVMERVLDAIAHHLKLDPADVRRRNLIRPDEIPYRIGIYGRDGKPMVYDSGDFPLCLEKALAGIDYQAVRRQQPELWRRGIYRGVGMALFVEVTGLGPPEGATVRVEPSGKVVVMVGPPSSGQSHRTTMAQICAAALGVDVDLVDVVGGDTALMSEGSGTHGSRVAVVAGNAVALAAADVRHQVLELAAWILEVPAELLVLFGDAVRTREGHRTLRLAEVARKSAEVTAQPRPGLERSYLHATRFFIPQAGTYSSGAHALVVDVDPELGNVRIVKYCAVDDCGNMINPRVCEGQIYGGLVQGLGEAFYERVLFDENGQPLVTSFLNYHLLTCRELPEIVLDHVITPSPSNPLGVKGVGESGGIPVAAAFCSAVEDALRPFGVRADRCPIDPVWIRDAVRRATAVRRGAGPGNGLERGLP